MPFTPYHLAQDMQSVTVLSQSLLEDRRQRRFCQELHIHFDLLTRMVVERLWVDGGQGGEGRVGKGKVGKGKVGKGRVGKGEGWEGKG